MTDNTNSKRTIAASPTCRRCGLHIDYSLPDDDPNAYAIDAYRRAVHARCTRSAGDVTATSRAW